MRKIIESLEQYDNDIVKALSELTNKSSDEIRSILSKIDADDYINLVAAIDTENLEDIDKLVSKVEPEQEQQPKANFVKQRIKEILSNKDEPSSKLDKVMDQVSKLTQEDWDMIWPGIDPKWLSKLYQKATDQQTDKVTQDQAGEIWQSKQEKVMEQVIYQDQIVSVEIPSGPGNTVGIVFEGQVKMVSRSEITSITENVIGMSSTPSLARIRELAGLPPIEPAPVNRSGMLEAGAVEFKVLMDFDASDPENLTRVKILGGGGSITLEGLRMKIARQVKEVNGFLLERQDYKGAAIMMEGLINSINTMIAAQDDLEKIRRGGGARARHINPRIAEDEDS